MPRWLRIIRGMIGTGLTFGAGVGVVAAVTGVLAWLANRITSRDLMQIVGTFSVVAFLLGVAFSGVLAIAARGRQFNKVSLRLVGALGAGAGLLYFMFLALNGGRNWSAQTAVVNLVLLTVMGAGSAVATFMIARRAGSARESDDEFHSLGAGDPEIVRARSSSRVDVPRL